MKEIAELFGGIDRLSVMKLFLTESRSVFTARKVSEALDIDGRSVRSILSLLDRAGFITEIISRPVKGKRKKKGEKEERRWRLNINAPYMHAFELLLKPSSVMTEERLLEHFSKLGRLHYVLLSGIFLDLDPAEYPIDLLIVADRVDPDKTAAVFDKFEEEIGEEVRYTLLSSEEYIYRKEMQDKLLREIALNPHRIVLNKLGRV